MPRTVPILKTRLFPTAAWWKPTVFITLLLATASCATHPKPSPPFSLREKISLDDDSRKIENALRKEYARWKGAKHKMGGTDQRGVDCSGFVRAIYGEVFHVNLPRTTKEQLRQGIPVSRPGLRAGDLVFFRPPGYPRHVGVYLGNNAFVHASKSQGVTISRIAPDFWGKYYWTARRVQSNH